MTPAKLLHVGLAVAAQIAIALPAIIAGVRTGWWIGAAAAAAWFLSREWTQAEYRWIEAHAAGRRSGMPRFSVVTDPRGVWSEKSWLWDAALPAAVVAAIAAVVS